MGPNLVTVTLHLTGQIHTSHTQGMYAACNMCMTCFTVQTIFKYFILKYSLNSEKACDHVYSIHNSIIITIKQYSLFPICPLQLLGPMHKYKMAEINL